MPISLFRELRKARAIFLERGVLPMHVAVKLMKRGYILDELEDAWDRGELE
jgi:hypothetical protein